MVSFGRRKAISPVLATVVLIAMTLISAISVSSFVFGLFGNFTTSARVQAQLASCGKSGNTCTLTLYNSGSGNAAIYTGASCATLTYLGQTAKATSCTGGSGSTVVGGSSLMVTLTFPSNFNAGTGAQLSGWISLNNGAQALFSGTFS